LTDKSPLEGSMPRQTRGWSSRSILFGSDSYHSPNPYNPPMAGAPTTATQVDPNADGKGFTSRPRDVMGSVGSTPENPMLGKMFATPTDPRMYKEPEPFSGPMPGAGTSKKDSPRFEYPAVGDSTTKGVSFGALTPSGSGLRDQADKRVGLENYHPQVSTGMIGQKKRFFK